MEILVIEGPVCPEMLCELRLIHILSDITIKMITTVSTLFNKLCEISVLRT